MGQPVIPALIPDVAWWVPDSWQEVAVMASTLAVLVGVVLSVIAAFRSHRKADDSAAARDQAVVASEVTVAAKDEIAWQFYPNHGSSMRDAIDDLTTMISGLARDMTTVREDVSSVKATVSAQGEQLKHGTDSIAEIRRVQQRHLEHHLTEKGGRRPRSGD